MKDSASLLDDEKRRLLKSGKPLPPELLPIPASVLLRRMKDEELKQTPTKRKGFNFDSDEENPPDKQIKITRQHVETTPTAITTRVSKKKVSSDLDDKSSISGRFSFDAE